MNDSERFDYFSEPMGQWTIWDNRIESPVCFSGIIMIGLSHSEARSMCGLLNQLQHARDEMERHHA